MTKYYIQGNDLFYSSINNIENKIKQAALSMNIELDKSS
jgi:hypothetical protein